MLARDRQTNQFKKVYVKALDSNVVGTILPYAGTTLPDNYMFCNGDAISRTTYSTLFNAIGTTFGSGDGSNTFNLPNFNGRVPVGLDSNDTDFDTLGETGGSKDIQEHSHLIKTGFDYVASSGSTTSNYAKKEGTLGSFTTESAGTGDSGNLQPYIVVNYIIKVSETTPRSSETVNTFSNSTKDAYSCDYSNNHQPNAKILWTNPNPTTAITSDTTITLSSDNYDMLEIFYKVSTSNDQIMSVKTIKGYPSRIVIPNTSGGINYRPLTRNSDTSYTIGALIPSSENTLCIPLYIIGYKTGLFS